MPAAVSVEEFRDVGDPAPLSNNSSAIKKGLDDHNEALGFGVDDGCGCRAVGGTGRGSGSASWALLLTGLAVAARRWRRLLS
jgi:hypothetical protein